MRESRISCFDRRLFLRGSLIGKSRSSLICLSTSSAAFRNSGLEGAATCGGGTVWVGSADCGEVERCAAVKAPIENTSNTTASCFTFHLRQIGRLRAQEIG